MENGISNTNIEINGEDRILAKVINPEGEVEIPIGNGERKKVFWSRIGFESRVYFRAYFKIKLKELIKDGFLPIEGNFNGCPEGKIDGENNVFTLNPSSFKESTLKIYKDSTLIPEEEYNYSPDLRVVFFNKAPSTPIRVKYEYYDQEIYNQLYQNSFIKCLIYLCAKDINDHNKKIFSNIEDIGSLTLVEINEIVAIQSQPREDELKK